MERLAGSVVALEEDAELAAVARDNLSGSSVELVEGPLRQGHAAGAPYDLILIDGAVEFIPEEIIGQLVDGGRLAAAILDNGVSRIALGRRAGEGFGMAPITDSASAILPAFVRTEAFTF
jgi:protein-L-isoaspartate(D-aspartate) O-methyltransferase